MKYAWLYLTLFYFQIRIAKLFVGLIFKCFQLLDKKLWHIYTMEYYTVIKKENNFCDSMDGLGEYYAKRNKPVIERQVPCDLTYMWILMNKIKWQTK